MLRFMPRLSVARTTRTCSHQLGRATATAEHSNKQRHLSGGGGGGGGGSSSSSSSSSVASASAETISFPSVPGVWLLKGFLSPSEHDATHAAAIELSTQVHTAALDVPDQMVSPAHNVNQEEQFKSVRLERPGRDVFGAKSDDASVQIQCEHFSSYGDGHRLSYFRYALPRLGLPSDTLRRLSEFPPVANEVFESRHTTAETGRPLKGPHRWRLTLNHYPPSESSGSGAGEHTRPGFPWHRDLKANGASTMIMALGGSAQLQFGRLLPSPCGGESGSHDGILYADHDATAESEVEILQDVTVEASDLLVLTGKGRWELLHRVLPATTAGGAVPDRASAVWGVW